MIHEELKDFPIIIDIPVAWGEMDSFQHVNNIVYFRYFENARIRYFEQSGIMENFQKTGIGPILAKTSAKFLKALHYPDQVSIGARVIKLSQDRFTHEYKIISHQSKHLVAIGEGVTVAFDYKKNQKSQFPTKILDKIQKLEGKKFL